MKCPRCGAEVGENPRTGKLFAHTRPSKTKTVKGSYSWELPSPAQEVCE